MNIFDDKSKLNCVINSFHISLEWCMHLKSLAFRYILSTCHIVTDIDF